MHEAQNLKEYLTIVLGYGDVGSTVVKRLKSAGVPFIVVDSNEHIFADVDFPYVVGNAVSESTLRKVGIERASTIIMTIGSDSDIIFAILVTRKLNPDGVILARATNVNSIDKMYKAGADYVASLSIISGQMLGRIALLPTDQTAGEETIMMYEGIEIEKYTVSAASPLAGKSLAELDMRNSTGCTVIGISSGEQTSSQIEPNIRIEEGMILAVLGNRAQIEKFRASFVR